MARSVLSRGRIYTGRDYCCFVLAHTGTSATGDARMTAADDGWRCWLWPIASGQRVLSLERDQFSGYPGGLCPSDPMEDLPCLPQAARGADGIATG